MCGLMALTGPVPADVVAAAAQGADARGPHSTGIAACLHKGSWSPWKARHGLTRLSDMALRPRAGATLVGHARLATSTGRPGDRPDPGEGQPLVDGGRLVAHNGTLDNETALGYLPDSLALLDRLIFARPVIEVLARQVAPQAALWADVGALWAARTGSPAHPLYVAEGDSWAAVSSGPLPGGTLVPEGTPHLLWSLTPCR